MIWIMLVQTLSLAVLGWIALALHLRDQDAFDRGVGPETRVKRLEEIIQEATT